MIANAKSGSKTCNNAFSSNCDETLKLFVKLKITLESRNDREPNETELIMRLAESPLFVEYMERVNAKTRIERERSTVDHSGHEPVHSEFPSRARNSSNDAPDEVGSRHQFRLVLVCVGSIERCLAVWRGLVHRHLKLLQKMTSLFAWCLLVFGGVGGFGVQS
jgi:hypothetical protein